MGEEWTSASDSFRVMMVQRVSATHPKTGDRFRAGVNTHSRLRGQPGFTQIHVFQCLESRGLKSGSVCILLSLAVPCYQLTAGINHASIAPRDILLRRYSSGRTPTLRWLDRTRPGC